MPRGPFCQSCAMPMDSPDKFGANADGSRNEDYCVHCYQQGRFTSPDATLEQMVDLCAGIMAQHTGMSKEDAAKQLNQFMPQLKRWRAKPQA